MTVHSFHVSHRSPADYDLPPDEIWTSISDVGRWFRDTELTLEEYLRVENLHLDAIRAFAEASLVESLPVQDAEWTWLASAAEEAWLSRHDPLFEMDDLLKICQLQLRERLWCRLHSPGQFYIYVGSDFKVFIGSRNACEDAVSYVERLGLFVHDGISNPYVDD